MESSTPNTTRIRRNPENSGGTTIFSNIACTGRQVHDDRRAEAAASRGRGNYYPGSGQQAQRIVAGGRRSDPGADGRTGHAHEPVPLLSGRHDRDRRHELADEHRLGRLSGIRPVRHCGGICRRFLLAGPIFSPEIDGAQRAVRGDGRLHDAACRVWPAVGPEHLAV